MKKINLLLTLVFILLISTVSANVEIITNTTSDIQTEKFTTTTQLNETTTFTTQISLNSDLSSPFLSFNGVTNATTHVFTFDNLEGGTIYYFEINGTSETPETSFSTGTVSQTTETYSLTGAVRTILNIFTLIIVGLFAFAFFGIIAKTSSSPKEFVSKSVVGLMGIIIIGIWLKAILKL